jgi:hypothetical protein
MTGPTIHPTGWRPVAGAALTGGGVTWLAAQAWLYSGGGLPSLGAGAWLPVLLCAVVTAWIAWTTHQAVGVRRESLEPRTAVTRLQLAKAGVLAAAAVGAGYLALLAVSLGGWPAPLAQARVLHGALAIVACLGWGIAALALERACRIPRPPEDPPESP